MQLKKAGGKVYGMQLSVAERKAMRMEIQRQIVESNRTHEIELDALVLWVLHEQFGFGSKRLKRFYDAFVSVFEELNERYLTDTKDEGLRLCTYKLKEIGVDVEAWHNKR